MRSETRWKDLVPDVSKLFPSIVPPKAVQGMPDAATLRDMLKETCVAEAVHVVLIPLGLWLLRLWQGIGGVMMFLIQLVPVLGLIMAAVWSFSPNSGINKRTISRALLIVQCIVLAVVCVFWCISYGFHG